MRNRLMITLLVAATIIAVSAVGNAAPKVGRSGSCMPMDWSMRLDRLTRELNLTPGQVTQLKQIHQDYVNATQAARDDLEAKKEQMKALWSVDQPDATAIKALADKIEKDRAEIRNAGIDRMISGLNVLTASQRAKLRNMAQKWVQKMRNTCPPGPGN